MEHHNFEEIHDDHQHPVTLEEFTPEKDDIHVQFGKLQQRMLFR